MKISIRNACAALLILAVTGCASTTPVAPPADPLPSWNGGESRTRIIDFVAEVTREGGSNYVPPAERIAVFDNDGTLWSEQPMYFQLIYALDVLREKAATDPSILTSDVLKAANDGDMAGMMAGGEAGLLEILNVSHGNITTEEFEASAEEWVNTATHPTSGRTYARMVYQPMLELLDYLRDEGFTTWIVSGGGIDFIRRFSDDAYGIPPWQVVGSQGKTSYVVSDDGVPTIVKEGGLTFLDDKEGKPVGIMRQIGVRPIMAVGNSDGDFQMLEWTTAGDGARLGVYIHHTDAEREWAYDRGSHIGGLERGLDEAGQRGWVLVNMKNDWNRIYPE